jgi:hypothetical protein
MKLPCAGRWFESIFGDENSEYKRWVRRLYDLGLIPEFRACGKHPKRKRENHLRDHPRGKRGAPNEFP